MIKYLGSKRRLIPALGAIAEAIGARTALDLFAGTTRVAQAWKEAGVEVTAVDSARYADVFARCYIATDAAAVDEDALVRELARLQGLRPSPGYVTETFCVQSRFFQPHNGARIDTIREAIAQEHAGSAWEPILLTSLVEAADRVDSTAGVQMAYLKAWAARSHQELDLRLPNLIAGPGHAWRGDATDAVSRLGGFDLVYIDPPYNQHRYFTNYHVWETLVAWDAPAHYGVACKRADARLPQTRSAFDSKRTMPDALAHCVAAADAPLVVISYNDEAWCTLDDLVAMGGQRGTVEVLTFDSRRYVGAQIGIHNPMGQKVGRVSHLYNREHLLLCGDPSRVRQAAARVRDEVSLAEVGGQPV